MLSCLKFDTKIQVKIQFHKLTPQSILTRATFPSLPETSYSQFAMRGFLGPFSKVWELSSESVKFSSEFYFAEYIWSRTDTCGLCLEVASSLSVWEVSAGPGPSPPSPEICLWKGNVTPSNSDTSISLNVNNFLDLSKVWYKFASKNCVIIYLSCTYIQIAFQFQFIQFLLFRSDVDLADVTGRLNLMCRKLPLFISSRFYISRCCLLHKRWATHIGHAP